jgi:hypothetical protein
VFLRVLHIHLVSSILFLGHGCIAFSGKKLEVRTSTIKKRELISTLNSISVANNQVTIIGVGFANVTNVKIQGENEDHALEINSKSDSQIIAVASSSLSLLVGQTFNLIIGTADAETSYTISFTLQDGAISANHLSSMGASSGQVLKYNGNQWAPFSLASSQLYIGMWNASSNTPNPNTETPAPGDYYIVSTAGTQNLSGVATNYLPGDWIIYNGTTSAWDKIANSGNTVSSFVGRTGVVTANEGDYSLTKMSDVDLTTTPPVNNQFLKYNGTSWVPGAVIFTETDPLVSAFAKSALPTCAAGQVLKGDGTTLTCVADNAGAGAFTGTQNRAVITDGATGALSVSAVTNTELDYLSGVTSAVQTQLNAKQSSDATLTALAAYNTNGLLVQTASDTFTGRSLTATANRISVTNGNGVAGNPTIDIDTTLFPSPAGGDAGKWLKATAANTSVWTALGLSDITSAMGYTPVNKAGDSLTSGTLALSGTAALTVQDPVNVLDAANKQYVDGFGQWTKSGADLYRSAGNVGIGTTAPSAPLTIGTAFAFDGIDHPSLTLVNSGTSVMSLEPSGPTVNGGRGTKIILGSGTTPGFIDFNSYLSMGTDNNSDFIWTTNNSGVGGFVERMRIKNNGNIQLAASGGNVGIGTTAPVRTLNVNGKALFGTAIDPQVTSTHTVDIVASGTDSPLMMEGGSGVMEFWKNSTPSAAVSYGMAVPGNAVGNDLQFSTYNGSWSGRMTILSSSGNVGIGTSSPSYGLDVTSASTVGSIMSRGKINETSSDLGVQIGYGPSGDSPRFWLGNGTAAKNWQIDNLNGAMRFFTPANVVMQLNIGPNFLGINGGQSIGNAYYTTYPPTNGLLVQGNVGIGTTAPGSALEVGTFNTTNSNIKTGSLELQPYSLNNAFINENAYYNGSTFKYRATGAAGMFYFQGSEGQFRFYASGTAGTTLPNNGNNTQLKVNADGTVALGGTINNNLANYTGASMLISSSGNVGIGTTGPGYKLDVQGGDINASGNVRAAGVALTSDRRWKRNILPLKNNIEKIMQINGVSYDWAIDDYPEKHFSNKRQIGVIAQDVQAVFPELVLEDKQGFLSVNYPSLIAPLIEAFKAQQQQIEANVQMFKTMRGEFEEIKLMVAENKREIASLKVMVALANDRATKLEVENSAIKKENALIKSYLCAKDHKAAFCK